MRLPRFGSTASSRPTSMLPRERLRMVPRVVAWFWATAVGVPLIWYWQYEYTGTGPFARLASD